MGSSKGKIYDFNDYKERTVKKKCIICGSKQDLGYFRKKHICFDCLNNIRKLFQEGYFTQAGI